MFFVGAGFILFVIVLVIALERLLRKERKLANQSQKTTTKRRDLVSYYVNMWPRPPAFVATGVPVEGRGKTDVMFFSGQERHADELDDNIRLILSAADSLAPVMPAEPRHQTACLVELDTFVRQMFTRLGKSNSTEIEEEDRATLNFFQVVLDDKPCAIMEAFKRCKSHNRGGTIAATRFLHQNRRPQLPDRPIRKATRSMVRVRVKS